MKILEHFKDNYFMIDKFELSKKVKSTPQYCVQVLKKLRQEKKVLRIRTCKKYYYKKNERN